MRAINDLGDYPLSSRKGLLSGLRTDARPRLSMSVAAFSPLSGQAHTRTSARVQLLPASWPSVASSSLELSAALLLVPTSTS
jgi:hypothetical protein